MNSDPLRHYAVMLKPVGSSCNLRCEYCYYLGKGKPSDARLPRMSDAVLESSVRQILEIHGRDAIVEFAWHGGEPALAGIDFFTRCLELQKKYGAGRKIINAIQTNGTTMNADWARFFAKNRFLVGVSLDGPQYLHDRFRHNAGGAGSFDGVMNAISLFREYGADYNILCTVNSENQMRGREVYRFLRGLSRFIQFLPVVECLPAEYESERGQRFAMPPCRRAAIRRACAIP